MQQLSAKQERVLAFVRAHLRRTGYPPTVREIAEGLGLAGPNSAKKYLDILERKGRIRREPGRSRAIELRGQPRDARARMLPVVGVIRAGGPALALEHIEGHVAVDASLARRDGMFLLRVRGDSMREAHVLDGDLALIRPQPEVASGDMAAVLFGDEATLKYFYKEKNAIRLKPANPAYDPIVIGQADAGRVRVIGKVVAVMRALE